MRLFLCVILFDIIFRSLSVLFPWAEWADQLDMRTLPVRLSTRDEMHKLAATASPDDPYPVLDDTFVALDSLWEFWKPWPEPAVRKKIRSWPDGGKWALTWLSSRLDLVENVIGFNEEWPMFSPSVGRKRWLTRARLVYADGTERIVRNHGDPADLTHYSHWFEEKVLDHELKVREGRPDEAFGYCNLLRGRYPENDKGSALVKIYLYVVRYNLPHPSEDAREVLAEQTGPPAPQVYPDFYVFDAATRHGKSLLERYD
jgi:hypothetical protein